MNDRVVGALCQVVDDPLMQEIKKFVTAKKAWTHLKAKTHQGGMISKLNTIHTAIRTRFVSHSTFSATILEIKDQIATIYNDKEPTREEWTIVLLLQALCDGEFEWMRKNLMSFITTSGMTLSSDDIIKRLETEAQETRVHEAINAQESALSAKQQSSSKTGSLEMFQLHFARPYY
ncbi:hypothetical protein K439DRAFT_1613121 [Ramaria rubella]|nr:hypothetical protein K439DRAFT_1613121 [Ramaria rubella]